MGQKITILQFKNLIKEEVKKRLKADEILEEAAKKKPSAGLTKKEKSTVVKKAKAGEDIGEKGKGFKEIEKKAKESGAKDPKAVAGAAMWKNLAKKKATKK